MDADSAGATGNFALALTAEPEQGPRRVKKSVGSNIHPWRARERESIMGVWGRSPSGGPGGRAHGDGSGGGAKPPEAEEVFV